ncbi:DMT family transporter [Planococcus soli]|uniref:DMT family transporter n=1 Tax=Planococcus soli TaxID=2666072 RepID=UPI00115EAFE8|nr:SMR family transporter [Planococcus soli]
MEIIPGNRYYFFRADFGSSKIFEVAFDAAEKLHAASPILSGALGFRPLSLALTTIALGTGYAVWIGIGKAGDGLIGTLFFYESRQPAKLFFLRCFIAGLPGRKNFEGWQEKNIRY